MTVLENAREILERGWHQGWFTDDHQNYCALGALGMASAGKCGQFDVHDAIALAKHLSDVGWTGGDVCVERNCMDRGQGKACTSVAHFNDDRTTRLEDVLALFDKTIADENLGN